MFLSQFCQNFDVLLSLSLSGMGQQRRCDPARKDSSATPISPDHDQFRGTSRTLPHQRCPPIHQGGIHQNGDARAGQPPTRKTDNPRRYQKKPRTNGANGFTAGFRNGKSHGEQHDHKGVPPQLSTRPKIMNPRQRTRKKIRHRACNEKHCHAGINNAVGRDIYTKADLRRTRPQIARPGRADPGKPRFLSDSQVSRRAPTLWCQ